MWVWLSPPARSLRVTPVAVVQTEPVPSQGDAADDPAIWVHPEEPSLSLVLGTDKKGGLNVFDLDGKCLQIISNGARPNNVDVMYGFPLGGSKVDLAVAGTRSKAKAGVTLWRIDPKTRRLAEIGPVPAFTVFGGGEPYGSCVYRSPRDKAFYVFITSKEGAIEQYRLDDTGNELRFAARSSARFMSDRRPKAASPISTLGCLYVSEETVGIWKFAAEPDDGSTGTLIARVGEHGLAADVEGLTIYYAAGDKGYLIASSQGANTFKVYERGGSNAFVLDDRSRWRTRIWMWPTPTVSTSPMSPPQTAFHADCSSARMAAGATDVRTSSSSPGSRSPVIGCSSTRRGRSDRDRLGRVNSYSHTVDLLIQNRPGVSETIGSLAVQRIIIHSASPRFWRRRQLFGNGGKDA